MKIKLPRKRKKAFIKVHGRNDYELCRISGEVIAEEGGKNAHKFPKQIQKHPFKILSYW